MTEKKLIKLIAAAAMALMSACSEADNAAGIGTNQEEICTETASACPSRPPETAPALTESNDGR